MASRPSTQVSSTPGRMHTRTRSDALKAIVTSKSPAKTSVVEQRASPRKGGASIEELSRPAGLQDVFARELTKTQPVLVEISRNEKSPNKPSMADDGQARRMLQKSRMELRSPKKEQGHPSSPAKLKESKSIRGLSSLLTKGNRSSKHIEQLADPVDDQENKTPPDHGLQSPIWAQFASQPLGGVLPDDHPFNPAPNRQLAPELLSKQQTPQQQVSRGHHRSQSEKAIPPARPQESSKPSWAQTFVKAKFQNGLDTPSHQGRSQRALFTPTPTQPSIPADLDAQFESVLDARNIPFNMRDKMRGLTPRVKLDFINANKGIPQSLSRTATPQTAKQSMDVGRREISGESDSSPRKSRSENRTQDPSSAKRGRSRSKTFSIDFGSLSPKKRHKSKDREASSRPTSRHLHKSPSSTSLVSLAPEDRDQPSSGRKTPKAAIPSDFVTYLRAGMRVQDVEVGRIHRLRLLVRNETVAWVNEFLSLGGMSEIIGLLHRIMALEWREDHEDQLLHETLLCLKGLCTTELALKKLAEEAPSLFPALLKMLFDPERKGPSEFTTRMVITNLLSAHIMNVPPQTLANRAREILSYLQDPQAAEEERPVSFILEMHRPRPYKMWCKEMVNVTKEVFWIFLHHSNVIALPEVYPAHATYAERHFPTARPPVPAAPYVGGVEWDATQYLASHLDLLNALIASLETYRERNQLREALQLCGMEKTMGKALRTCKEKFYSAVHDGLRTWVTAAREDGWKTDDVRFGPRRNEGESTGVKSDIRGGSPAKSPAKKQAVEPPKLELAIHATPAKSPGKEAPRVDFGEWI